MTRRTALICWQPRWRAPQSRLPANRNVRWALGANLWNYFPRVPFTDILDVMRDTGFIGIRLTQFPQILKTYDITAEALEKEVSRRNLHVITISFNGPAHDAARREEVAGQRQNRHDLPEAFRRRSPGGVLAQPQRGLRRGGLSDHVRVLQPVG